MIALFLLSIHAVSLPPDEPLPPVPGYDRAAPVRRAPGTPAPPPVPDDVVVADFLEHLAQNPAYGAEARAFVEKRRAEIPAADLKDFINLSLSVLSPEFKRGLDLLDEDDPAAAADLFEALSRSDDPFMAVAAANLGATALIEREEIRRCQTLLDRVREAHKPIERYTTASDHFRFMLGYCQVHDLAYDRAYATFEDFLGNHPGAPERLRVTAAQILTELKHRAPGRLGDVRDLLTYARRRIAHGLTDDDVLNRQDEAVELLDALIEEAEDRENQGGGDCEGGGGQGGGGAGGNRPGGGAKRSTLPQGSGGVGELRRTRARPGEVWGRMPPKQREQVLQTLQKQFPSQYRELLEQYYKQLAKDAPSP